MADWLERKEVQPPRGGTEIMREGLSRYTTIDERDFNLILCNTNPSKIRYTKKNILWQHNNYSDESVVGMRDRGYMKAVNATVYVSHWQYEKYRYLFQVPTRTSHIIKNSIEPIPFQERVKGEKIRLIYTSAPFRGLEVLLDVVEFLDRDDIEVDVYSSPLSYGTAYQASVSGQFDNLLERAGNTKSVNYHGYATNDEVKVALSAANIFAYPSIFEETACLSLIEAGAAGCRLVTTDLGALYETGSEWATLVPIQSDYQALVAYYAEALSHAIDTYWQDADWLRRQSDFYNDFYSWQRRAPQWEALFDSL